MKKKYVTVIIITLLIASVAAYLYISPLVSPRLVHISDVVHEVSFSGVKPPNPSDQFFNASFYSSGFTLNPGNIFNDTLSFHSVPSLQNYSIMNISIESSSSGTFSIVAMNATLPTRIHSINQTSATILLTIRAPDSAFNGEIIVQVTIGP